MAHNNAPGRLMRRRMVCLGQTEGLRGSGALHRGEAGPPGRVQRRPAEGAGAGVAGAPLPGRPAGDGWGSGRPEHVSKHWQPVSGGRGFVIDDVDRSARPGESGHGCPRSVLDSDEGADGFVSRQRPGNC
jgi:hypothetical protein